MASHATGMLSMQDVADLAGVSRQAVTNWRRRPRTAHGRVNPFPSPALSRKGSDYFDQEAIVTWLEETGRGKNREASFDAPALVPPEGADMELLVMLLCLRAGSFDDLHALDAHDLAELAHTTDPDDAFLNAEMSAAIARSGLHEALEYIDALFDASTGAEDALRRITTGRLAREAAKRRYSPDYLTVIRAVLEGIGEARGPLSVVVDDADLLPAVAVGTLAFDRTAQSASGLLSVREVLRRAYIVRMSAHEWDSTSFTADSLDSFTTENHSRTALRLVSLHGLPPEGALDVLDSAYLDLAEGESALVIGPATVLLDRLRGNDQTVRDRILRERSLEVALRLPRALWNGAVKQEGALWLLTRGAAADRPYIADVTTTSRLARTRTLALGIDLDGLQTDVFAALTTDDRRAFTYLRNADIARILSGLSSVVPAGYRASHLSGTATEHFDRIEAATAVTSVGIEGLDVLVERSMNTALVRELSVGELLESGRIRILNGRKVDRAVAVPNGTVEVVDLDPTAAPAFLDPFDLDKIYPGAKRTEPGDIVFRDDSAGPIAEVDADGGRLVATPARILRLGSGAPVGPYTVAALINTRFTGKHPTWRLPRVLPPQKEMLEAHMRDLEERRHLLEEQTTALNDLVTALADGVSSGSVRLTGHEVITTDAGSADNGTDSPNVRESRKP